jgi:YD repeat-containing protein
VFGTVDDAGDPGGVTWVLEYAPTDGTVGWRTIASGSGEVADARLGTFDPTLLANGAYTLRLTATNSGGSSEATATVSVEGKLKLGNFRVEFTDLSIPVAGIPITVNRVYDTLDAAKERDFGYGWHLEFGGYTIRVDESTLGPSYGGYPAFVKGTRVYVEHADGTVDGYTFEPRPRDPFAGSLLEGAFKLGATPYFTPDAGVSNRLIADPDLQLSEIAEGQYVVFGDDGDLDYHPARFGGVYTLITPDHVSHTLDARTGKLRAIIDRYSNSLTLDTDGIHSNRGRSVVFERDYRGRIVSIKDPRGHAIIYGYDSHGDLTSVTDRAQAVGGFSYLADTPHYLEAAIDPYGRSILGVTYNASGRVETVADAHGQTSTRSYDVSTRTEILTDPNQGTTTQQYDSRGNITRIVDATGQVETTQYDGRDRVLKETLVVLLTSRATNSGHRLC